MNDRPHFTGAVSADGKSLRFDAPVYWLTALARMKGKRVTVVLDRERGIRSTAQNSRYWGVIVPVCQEILSQGRTLPLSKDQTHFVLKMAFLGQEETPLGPVPMRSRDLDTAQFCTYCDKIEAHFRTELGATFPDEQTVREAGL